MKTTDTNTLERELVEIAKAHDGQITPESVLRRAKRKSSPLHSHFEWDDSKAAEQHRIWQASCLIRRVKVEIQPSENRHIRVRGWVNIKPDEVRREKKPGAPKGVYVPLETALGDDDYRAQMLERAKSEARTFREKYANLEELSEVHESIDSLES